MNLRKLSAALLAMSLTIAQAGLVPLSANAQESPKLQFNSDLAKQTITVDQVQSAISAIDKLAQKQIDENVVPGMAISVVFNDK